MLKLFEHEYIKNGQITQKNNFFCNQMIDKEINGNKCLLGYTNSNKKTIYKNMYFRKLFKLTLDETNDITELMFGNNYNSDYLLPINIKILLFGINFNNSVNNLPTYLTHLDLGFSFNQQVNNLPHSLIYLVFGYYFNQSVNYLPENIEYIYFHSNFNNSVENLPLSLKYLLFDVNSIFNKSLNNLPNSLTFLQIGIDFDLPIENLPLNLKTAKCLRNYKYIDILKNKNITIELYNNYEY